MATVIEIENVSKEYNLGAIGTGTLNADFQSWWARVRGKEDPNTVLGEEGKRGRKGSFYALKGINVQVQKGEALGIIGANGAGKSTLLKILSRITTPTTGEVRIRGKVSSMLEVGTGFHPEMTGRENIYMNGAILGMSREEIDSKLEQIIEFSECESFIDTPVKRYSSGMYVKLAFSVSAHLDSDILIMDEVLAVGDARFQEKCLKKMTSIIKEEGRTILFVSHNVLAIRKMCTRCIVLEHGGVVFDGSVDDAAKLYMEDTIEIDEADLASGQLHPTADIRYQPQVDMQQVAVPLLVKGEEAPVTAGRPFQFRLTWRQAGRAEAYALRLGICYFDGTHAGLTVSEPFSGTENAETTTVFAVPTARLAPGKYYFIFDLLRVDEQNPPESQLVLTVSRKTEFTVSEESHQTLQGDGYCLSPDAWDHLSWGHVLLEKTRVIK